MYLNRLFYLLMTAVILVIALGFALPPLFTVGKVLLALLVVAVVADVGLLYNWWPFRHSQSVNPIIVNQLGLFARWRSDSPMAMRTR